MRQIKYTYRFNHDISIDAVKDSLNLAVMAVEGLKGRTRIQLEARFQLDRTERICTIDANTEVGENIARIFTGFLTKEFGEKAFKVERVIASTEELPKDKAFLIAPDKSSPPGGDDVSCK